MMVGMPAQAPDDRLASLAELVRDARTNLGMSIDAAAERAPMSPVTWSKVESGKPVTKSTYAGVERSLSWAPGSIDLYLRTGADPHHVHDKVGVTDTVTATVFQGGIDDDLRTIDHLPIPASRKLELMRQYLRLVKEAADEAAAADGQREAG
jgi:transcriptional regulator with XRE-family HTH domain